MYVLLYIISYQEEIGVSESEKRENESNWRDVVDVVEVVLVGLLVGGLVLSDRVHQRVARARVLNEESADASGERTEVALREYGERFIYIYPYM